MQNRKFSQRIGYAFATLIGWKVSVTEPTPAKCVIVGAFHTSGWDLALTLILKLSTGLPFRFVVKSDLVHGLQGRILRRMGAVPVDRTTSQDFVAQVAAAFAENETFMIAISPEGSRNQEHFWRTGFYYIAHTANVPVVFGYGDYRRKIVGLGPLLWPSGDIEADFEIIRTFYAGVTAKYPENQGDVRTRSQIPPQEA